MDQGTAAQAAKFSGIPLGGQLRASSMRGPELKPDSYPSGPVTETRSLGQYPLDPSIRRRYLENQKRIQRQKIIDEINAAKEEAIGDFDFSNIEGWQSKAEQLSFPGWGIYDKPGLPSGYPGTSGSLNKQIATGPDPYLPGLEPINTMMNPVWNNQTQEFEYPMRAAEG